MRTNASITQPVTPVAFLLLLFFTPSATSFHASSVHSPPFTTTTGTSLKAVIYGLSEEDHEDESYSSGSLTLDGQPHTDGRKVPPLLMSPDWTAPLARLASARSAGVKLEHIHQVSVNRVDAVKLDIEAIVCERDDCVSLSVPVDLPRPCVDEDTEESFERCIVDNLAVLDQANQEASASTVFATEEDVEMAKRVEEELTSLHDIEYPAWWSSSQLQPTAELQQECATLCNILNEEEFQADLKALVSTRCVFREDDIHPGYVHVLQIGPSGLIVRATALQAEKLMGITEIPIPFAAPADSTDILREYVLTTVEQHMS